MKAVNGKTKVCGLIGNPVEHTLSPLIHNAIAEKMGQNMVYVPFPTPSGGLGEAVRGAFALGILGINITVPYKSEVIPFLEEIAPLAARIGAVNTLVRGKEGYIGYNTDAEGLYRAMQSDHISIEGEDIILLGAGGASRAAAYMCAGHNAKSIWLLNRSPEKAIRLAAEVNHAAGWECVTPMALADHATLPERRFLVIQGTGVGLYPDTEQAVIEAPSFYRRIHTGYDVIYNPSRTKFMMLTKQYGGEAYNGLKMLFYQAILAYELMHHITISEEDASQIFNDVKENMKM